MKRYYLLLTLSLPLMSFAQTGIDTGRGAAFKQFHGSKTKYTYIEQMPQTPFDLKKYIDAHISYPADAHKNRIEGRLVLRFIVTSHGYIEHITVVKPLYPSLDSEAVRIFRLMPPWKPGKQDGKALDVFYTVPVDFHLHDLK